MFYPKNPQKYMGDPTNILCRSSWEREVCILLDRSPTVIKWASEEFAIPYKSPLDNKIHQYYPDFYIEWMKEGKVYINIAEVKPHKQTYLKPRASKKTKMQYAVNTAKWQAAKQLCEEQGFNFELLTEKTINAFK